MSATAETNIAQPQIVDYDPRTPVTTHEGFMATMYGKFFRNVDSVLNVAAGHTDLGADLQRQGIDVPVTSLDPTYAHDSREDRVAGYAQAMPFEDESFAMTVCQFGMQHIPEASVGDAIKEMVRVTKTADDTSDPTKGIIFINPAFRSRKLKQALQYSGVVAGVMEHDTDNFALANRKNVMPTLWIQKTSALTPERLEAVITAVTQTEALRPPYRSWSELTSRMFGGRSKV